jgi:high-affinity nickel-transport protein
MAFESIILPLVTALLLGIRHGIDWDHIAAIADITSTTAGADAAEIAHEGTHGGPSGHDHPHGGPAEAVAHGRPPLGAGPGAMLATGAGAPQPATLRERFVRDQRLSIVLGTLYALGHALVVAILGLIALLFGALLPDWVDPVMGRVVGITLIVLGAWVFVSLYQYARYGREFRLRSRWMIVFDGVRYAWRRLQARLHGHEHAEPLEMSAYGPRTSFAVGMIHGIGAETGTQVLIIASIGGATGIGLGVPMMLAFIVGLLISNTAIIVLSATGFVAGQLRTRIYIAIGVLAGVFSLVVGALFLFGAEGALPSFDPFLQFLPSE